MATPNRSEIALRQIREKIYAQHFYHSPVLSKDKMLKELLKHRVTGEYHTATCRELRAEYFKKLVLENFNRDAFVAANPWPAGSLEGLDVFKELRKYAITNYGSAVIRRMSGVSRGSTSMSG